MLLQMIEMVTESGDNIDTDLRHHIALSMAKAAAIKVGQVLTQSEIEHLLSDLFKLSMPNYTPDGKTIIANISIEDLNRLFV